FFSSRRRHTRFSRDWSSDVCSSDLVVPVDGRAFDAAADAFGDLGGGGQVGAGEEDDEFFSAEPGGEVGVADGSLEEGAERGEDEIGRASCRERGEACGDEASG